MLEEKYLHADETKIEVMNEKGKNTTDSFMWVYGTYKDSKIPIRSLNISPQVNGDHPKKFLRISWISNNGLFRQNSYSDI